MSDTIDRTQQVKTRFRKLMRSSMIACSKSGNPVLATIAEHFGADPAKLPFLHDEYPFHLIINRQAGINAFLAEDGRESDVKGVVIPSNMRFERMSSLLLPPSFPVPAPRWGQLGEERREAGFKKWMTCLTQGLILFTDAEGPGAIWVNGHRIEAMAPTAKRAGTILTEIRRLGIENSPYKGECVNIFVWKGVLKPQFQERPQGINAEDVILPPGLLERVDEHVLGIARQGERLLKAGRHLKRGLLLWGRPGTGKTHTIRYLASQLPNHTMIILPGSRLENLYRLGDMIGLCTPGIVVLDDVDYIAEDRTMPSMSQSRNLFELLEALDGVTPDADLLFVLTTNRADTIEPAIAARPGRVDQAAEIPPPDSECRERLFALYSKGISLDMTEPQVTDIIKRTDGVTGSFFKELLRRATLDATTVDRRSPDGKIIVTNDQVTAALDEMLDPSNPLTPKMLGLEGHVHDLISAEDEDANSAA